MRHLFHCPRNIHFVNVRQMILTVEETLQRHLIFLIFIFREHLVKDDAALKTFLPRPSVFGLDSNLAVRKETAVWQGNCSKLFSWLFICLLVDRWLISNAREREVQSSLMISVTKYRVIRNDCRAFNNLSYTIHFR